MKLTKRAKVVAPKVIKTEVLRMVYICPSCKVEFHGSLAPNVMSWICDCGQLLKKGK